MLVSLDIGGTSAKCVVFVPEKPKTNIPVPVSEAQRELESSAWAQDELKLELTDPRSGEVVGKLVFFKMLSRWMEGFPYAVAKNGAIFPAGTQLFATGGGAHKYEDVFDQLGFKLSKFDEIGCLVQGMRIMSRVPGEFFQLKSDHFNKAVGFARAKIEPIPTNLLPSQGFLVVSIGSGVSFVHCTESSHKRVGGSSLGGSTFLGLVALLTGEDRFDKAIDLAAKGDSSKADMLVKDIYGGSTEKNKDLFGLKPTTLASSFGKAISRKARKSIRKEDLALSALIMISMNVGAMAHLHAKAHNCHAIVLTGNFLARNKSRSDFIKRHSRFLSSSSELHLHKRNAIAMKTLQYSCHFWSGGERIAVFCKREGYLGCIGALSEGMGSELELLLPTEKDHHSSKL